MAITPLSAFPLGMPPGDDNDGRGDVAMGGDVGVSGNGDATYSNDGADEWVSPATSEQWSTTVEQHGATLPASDHRSLLPESSIVQWLGRGGRLCHR